MATSILDATEEQLVHAQAKITYLGEQDKPVLSLVILLAGNDLSMDMFVEVQTAAQPYDNDTLDRIERANVSVGEFRAVLEAVKPVVTAPKAAHGPAFLSFCVVRKSDDGVVGEEFRIGPGAAAEFYDVFTAALHPDNKAAAEVLERQRHLVILEP